MSNQDREECQGSDDGIRPSGASGAGVSRGNIPILTQRIDQNQNNNSRLKRASWLRDHFLDIKRDNKLLYICKACDKEYSNRSVDRLKKHFDRCTKTDKSLIPVNFEEPPYNQVMNELWTKVCIENNISFRAVESSTFKEFAAKLNKMTKKWQLPLRHDLSGVCVPGISKKLHDKFIKDLKDGVIFDLSLEFDHWRDSSKTEFMGVVATNHRGETYLIDLKDVSRKDKRAEVIVEDLISILRSMPDRSVNALVSDSASSCKKARRLLVERDEFNYIIEHRCLAHLFNRVGSKITADNKWITDTISFASKITTWFTNSPFWLAKLAELNHKRPLPACPVRWYSTVNMLDSILQLRAVIVEELALSLPSDTRRDLEKFKWADLKQILQVLCPINRCIGRLERKNASLGEGFRDILLYARDLFSNPPESSQGDIEQSETNSAVTNPSEALIAARKSFLWHFNTKNLTSSELGLYIAAYIFNPRFRSEFLTKAGIDLALKVAVRIGLKSGITMQMLSSTLIARDFDNYLEYGQCYHPATEETKVYHYWLSKSSLGPIAKIAMRLANLKATSANIERAFSSLNYIKGKHRTRLSNSTFIDMGRIKLTLNHTSEYAESLNVDDDLRDVISEGIMDSSSSPELDLSANNDSIASDSSEITDWNPDETPDWLNEVDDATRARYDEFNRYIDFSASSSHNFPASLSSSFVSDEEIMEAILSRPATQEATPQDVIIDTNSQIAQFGPLSDYECEYDVARSQK